MSTLPTGVYANLTTPLWATAAAGQQFVSPSEVVNQDIPPTAELTTFVTTTVPPTGSFSLNTIPNGTPLNEIRLEGVTEGITMYTNGSVTLQSAPYGTAVLGDLFITSRQTGATWNFNNNELSYSNVKQLTGDEFFTQLGSNTYTDDFGLSVWNIAGSSNKTSTISDREIYFTSTTGGTNLNQTFSFVSPFVPFITSIDPLRVTANPRTPIYPNDAIFYPETPFASLTVTGGSGTPYSIQITNNSPTLPKNGIGCSMGKTNGNNFNSNDFPFWLEIDIFDPLTNEYIWFDGAQTGNSDLLKEIKKVGGVITGIFLNSGTGPITLNVGDKIRAIYEWADQANRIPRIVMTKNNIHMTTTILPAVSFILQSEPTFMNFLSVPAGFSYTLQYNYGNTNPIIASFNDWEWTAGLGGLYGYNNSAIRPVLSGTSPNATIYYSTVYLKNNCSFTSPPITINTGLTVTVSAYSGSKLGLGTINVYANNSLIYTAVASPSWIQGNLGTFVSTGSDTLVFEFVGAPTDTLSLQRINLAYNNEIDVLEGGMGMNGTNLNIGAGNYYSSPTISMTSSNISVTKPINMNANTISNATFSGTSTGTHVGNVQTNSITPISPTTETAVGNLDLNTNTLSRGTIRPFYIGNSAPFSNVVMQCPLDMNNQNILQANTINSETILNQGGINTFGLTTSNINSTNSGTNLLIGSNSFQVNLSNVGYLYGRGQFAPMLINMVDTINQVSACATGGIYIQVNFDGFKQVMIPLIPTWSRSTTECYQLVNPNYYDTDGYLLVGKSELVIYDQFLTVLSVHTNNGDTPRTFFNNDLILNTPNRLYTYRPYLAGL